MFSLTSAKLGSFNDHFKLRKLCDKMLLEWHVNGKCKSMWKKVDVPN
jgi:hypothetical protein